MIRHFLIYFLILFLVGCAYHPIESDANIIEIDFSNEIGTYYPFTDYLNSSVRKAPPIELAEVVRTDVGKAKIMRCWLMLDQMWDYRTDTYDFNFKIGQNIYQDDPVKFQYNWNKVVETPYYYEDHLKSFCDNNQEVMLVVNRYHREVVDGTISIDQWREIVKRGIIHYLSLCPNLSYIEVLNETAYQHFGGLTAREYYMFYQQAYEVVNEINQELAPAIPLKVGGPTSTGTGLVYSQIDRSTEEFFVHNNLQQLYLFLKNFAEDKNPEKKLDFISFHEYAIGNINPKGMSEYESIIDDILKEMSLDTDMPIFIDESGINPISEITSKHQATGILTMHQYIRESNRVRLFPWVTYHTVGQQPWVMYDTQLQKTAFGMTGVLANMHKETEVYSFSSCIDENGMGVHVVATKEEDHFVIHLWNYSANFENVEIFIRGIEEDIDHRLLISEFVVDSPVYDYKIDSSRLHKSASFIRSLSERETFEVGIDPYTSVFLFLDAD